MNVAVKELSKREVQKIAKKAEYEGRIYPSKRFGDMVIIEYLNCKEVVIKFLNTGHTTKEWFSSVKSGEVRDKSLPSECGVGFIDIEGAATKGVMTLEYKLWNNMINRCYNQKVNDRLASYKDCTVSNEFKYFSKFKGWCSNQIGFNQKDNKGKLFALDKDILVRGNRVYSPETCAFVPQEINSLIVSGKSYRGDLPVGVVLDKGAKTPRYRARLSKEGKYYCYGSYPIPEEAFYAYKQAKEAYIKEVADKYKDVIDPRVYKALYEWTINIDD